MSTQSNPSKASNSGQIPNDTLSFPNIKCPTSMPHSLRSFDVQVVPDLPVPIINTACFPTIVSKFFFPLQEPSFPFNQTRL